MHPLIIVFFVSIVFFALIPAAGAFIVRSRWRSFRSALIYASRRDTAGYPEIRKSVDKGHYGRIGFYKFFGTLEAIQGENLIWLTDGKISIGAGMEGVNVFQLPSNPQGGEPLGKRLNIENFPEQMPGHISWKRLSTLTEGTKVFISGPLYSQNGRAVFRSDEEQKLTAVIYDGEEKDFLIRSIWTGRQRNEYWNFLTPGSLAVGALILIVLSYIFLRNPMQRLTALSSISFGIAPFLPLFPPGVVFFFLYRWLWKRGRYFRAERDLLRLPLRYFSETADRSRDVLLPGNERYGEKKFLSEDLEGLLKEGFFLRVPSVEEDGGSVYFGYGRIDDDNRLSPPSDPLAEAVIIPGDPEYLSSVCERNARMHELASALLFFSGIIINLYLFFIVLSRLLR